MRYRFNAFIRRPDLNTSDMHVTNNAYIRYGYIISCTALTVLLSQGAPAYMLILGIVFSFFISLYLTFKADILRFIFSGINKKYAITASMFTLLAGYNFALVFYRRFGHTIVRAFTYLNVSKNNGIFVGYVCTALLALASAFALFSLYYYLTDIFAPYISRIKRHKKVLFAYFAWTVCVIVLFIYVSTITNAFAYPLALNGTSVNNVIFGTDGRDYTGYNSQLIFFDNFRHPFFSAIFMPITGICWNLSAIAAVFVNLDFPILFSIFYCVVQIISTAFTALILYALLRKSVPGRIAFWGGLLYLTTFPALFFSIMAERFSLEVLLLIAFFYLCMESGNLKHKITLFLLSTGSVISSCAAYPAMLAKEQFIKAFHIKLIFKIAILLIIAIVLFGNTTLLYSFLPSGLNDLKYTNTSNSVFDHSMLQYLSFESGMYFAPNWQSIEKPDDFAVDKIEMTSHIIEDEFPKHGITQAYPQDKVYYFIGFGIMCLSFAGFFLCAKDKLAQIAFWWFCMGIVLLAIVGLGSALNEMYLYLSYFSWAQVILAILLINKLIKSMRIKTFLLGVCSVVLFIANIYSIFSIATALGVGFLPLF